MDRGYLGREVISNHMVSDNCYKIWRYTCVNVYCLIFHPDRIYNTSICRGGGSW
jgi:hypothetical protein